MTTRLFGCGKYRRLATERSDRPLSAKEEDFYARHRGVCHACVRFEEQTSSALNLLKGEVLETVPSSSFDERIVRRWRLQRQRTSLAYWSPALAGAAIAGLVIVSALQLISRSTANLPPYSDSSSEARLELPELIIEPRTR